MSRMSKMSISMLRPLHLHARDTGPDALTVAIALELLEIPYEVNPGLSKSTTAAHDKSGDADQGLEAITQGLLTSSFPQTPTSGLSGDMSLLLQDPNTGVTVRRESGAMLNYIRRTYDRPNELGPRGHTEQDRVDLEEWEFALLGSFAPAMRSVLASTGEANEDDGDRDREEVGRVLEGLEVQLKGHGGRFILPGDGPSGVDVHFYPWVRECGAAVVWMGKFPGVKKWVQGFGEVEAVRSACARVGKGERYRVGEVVLTRVGIAGDWF